MRTACGSSGAGIAAVWILLGIGWAAATGQGPSVTEPDSEPAELAPAVTFQAALPAPSGGRWLALAQVDGAPGNGSADPAPHGPDPGVPPSPSLETDPSRAVLAQGSAPGSYLAILRAISGRTRGPPSPEI